MNADPWERLVPEPGEHIELELQRIDDGPLNLLLHDDLAVRARMARPVMKGMS